MAVVVMGGDSLGWTLDRADTLDTSALQITHPLIDSAGSQCRLDTLATGHRHSAPCSIVNRLPVTIFAAPASFPTLCFVLLIDIIYFYSFSLYLTVPVFQVGINPGLYAAFKQHHYAGPGNHFCK